MRIGFVRCQASAKARKSHNRLRKAVCITYCLFSSTTRNHSIKFETTLNYALNYVITYSAQLFTNSALWNVISFWKTWNEQTTNDITTFTTKLSCICSSVSWKRLSGSGKAVTTKSFGVRWWMEE